MYIINNRTKSIKLFIHSSIVCCFLLLYNSNKLHCQQFQASTPPLENVQPPQLYSQPLPISSSSQSPLMLDTGIAEARGDMSTATNLISNSNNNNKPIVNPTQANAIEQIVNFLANYAATNPQQQGSINNNFNNNQRRPNIQTTNRNQIQSLQVPSLNQATNTIQSGNGLFLNNNNPIPLNRQRYNPNNNNNNQQFQFNSQQLPPQSQLQQQVNNNNNQIFVSSSPATPYLTLNKLASFANNNQLSLNSNNVNSNNNRPLFNQQPSLLSQNSRQPIGIPLGPPRGMVQPQRVNNNNNSNQPLQIKPLLFASTPIPPAIQMNNNQHKPTSSGGFAPSGPPPSMMQGSTNNPSTVVVTSPQNSQNMNSSTTQPSTSTESSRISSSQATTLDDIIKTTTISSTTSNNNAPETNASTNTISTVAPDSSNDNNTISSISAGKGAIPSDSTTTTTTAGTSTASSLNENTQENNWNPVLDINRTSSNSLPDAASTVYQKNKLAPSLDIVTVPPGYNPDNPNNQPQNYDISVSAQMGGSNNQKPLQVLISTPQSIIDTIPQNISKSSSIESSISVAPTAVTTIIWSPPADDINQQQMIAPTSTSSPSLKSTSSVTPDTGSSSSSTSTKAPPTRIRDNSLLNSENYVTPDDSTGKNNNDSFNTTTDNNGIVYGKPQARDSKPAPPKELLSPSPVTGQANIETSVQGRPFIQPVQIDNQVRPYLAGARQQQPQQQQQQQAVVKSNHHQSTAPFKPSRPLNGQSMSPGMSIGSGFTITSGSGNQTMPVGDIQDYVANQPPLMVSNSNNNLSNNNDELTISAHGGQDPASFEFSNQSHNINNNNNSSSSQDLSSSSSASPSSTVAPTRVRRPTFKPKPAIPPIRIDSCIVGDDTSCDQSHNERCVTEYGISSCHCKPGFARLSQLRGYCSPISLFQLSMKIDRLSDDRKLAFNYTLENSNSEEYQYLEFESIQAMASAFQQTNLAKQFMGIKVNKFFERKGKVWVNMSVSLELNNLTKSEKIQTLVTQELQKVILNQQQSSTNSNNNRQSSFKSLGDSTIVLDTSNTKETISRLSDINECSSKELNDCGKHASCINDFGGFQCQCLPGFEDKHLNSPTTANLPLEEKSKLIGRVCLGCSPGYCLNRGECSIIDGKKQCKCKQNFFGSRCDFDGELWTIVGGGVLIAILMVSIGVLYIFYFNRRWKRQQQKMDAMSATSGLTFNYVNSNSTNSLMSPSNGKVVNGNAISARTLGGSGAHQAIYNQQQQQHQVALGALAANYGQRFGAALVNGTRGNINISNYTNGISSIPADQMAIIGSTSSGSSAASQPIGSLFQSYEDAGLLIAPATNSNGSSEQTSPSSNCANNYTNSAYQHAMLVGPGNGYTLSGHHHHHHHQPLTQAHHHHHHNTNKSNHHHHHQITTQFQPAAAGNHQTDYRTMNGNPANLYDARWRTLQQAEKPSSALYYLVSFK